MEKPKFRFKLTNNNNIGFVCLQKYSLFADIFITKLFDWLTQTYYVPTPKTWVEISISCKFISIQFFLNWKDFRIFIFCTHVLLFLGFSMRPLVSLILVFHSHSYYISKSFQSMFFWIRLSTKNILSKWIYYCLMKAEPLM